MPTESEYKFLNKYKEWALRNTSKKKKGNP